MTWTKVLAENELSLGKREVVKLGKFNLLLLNHEGKLYALDNLCPHLKLSLKKGKINAENAIVCPWHRSAFALDTGEAKEWTTWPPVVGKAMGMISKPKPLAVFPLKLEDGSIWVDIPE